MLAQSGGLPFMNTVSRQRDRDRECERQRAEFWDGKKTVGQSWCKRQGEVERKRAKERASTQLDLDDDLGG